jgi:hypothetical protein
MMRKFIGILLLLLMTPSVNASITIGVSGPGTLLNTYEGPVVFPQIAFTGDGTITTWAINGFNPVIKTVGYAEGDLDFTGAFNSGFRWAETLTNNSGVAWSNFVISLTDTTATFSGAGNFLNTGIGTEAVPGFAAIVGNSITVLSTLGTPLPVTGWEMNLSADQQTITMDFPTPVLPGQSVQVHVPIVNVGDGDGSLVLSQQAGAVPEPTTFIVWSMLLSITLTFGLRQRN